MKLHIRSKRVPAEWEPQEAIWMQWPGYWEKDYELTFAKITNIISRYEKLHILYNSDQIYAEAQKAIRDIGQTHSIKIFIGIKCLMTMLG